MKNILMSVFLMATANIAHAAAHSALQDVCTGGGFTVTISGNTAQISGNGINATLDKLEFGSGAPEDRDEYSWPEYDNGSASVTYFDMLNPNGDAPTKYHAAVQLRRQDRVYLVCQNPK